MNFQEENRIDQYFDGALTEDEVDDLWADFLADEDLFDRFRIEHDLRIMMRERWLAKVRENMKRTLKSTYLPTSIN